MLELAWTELSEVANRVKYLEAQRYEDMRANVGRSRSIESELARAISERERLVARIASLMKAGALDEPQRATYRHAA